MNFKKMRKELEKMNGEMKEKVKAFLDVAEGYFPTVEDTKSQVYMNHYKQFISMK